MAESTLKARRVVGALGVGLALVSLTGYAQIMIGSMLLAWGWHGAIALTAFAVYTILVGDRVASTLAIVGAMVAAAPHLFTPPRGEVSAVIAPCARVIAVNAFERNTMPTVAIAASIVDADVVLLVEPRPGLVDELAKDWSIPVRHTVSSKFDLAVLVAEHVSVTTSTVHRFEGTASVVGEVVLACPEGPLRLMAIHIPAPTKSSQLAERDVMRVAVAALIANTSTPTVVAGDFNSVLASPVLGDLASRAGLSVVSDGATWPTILGAFGIGIDHVLVRNVAIEVEPFVLVGSDHSGFRFAVSPRPRGS